MRNFLERGFRKRLGFLKKKKKENAVFAAHAASVPKHGPIPRSLLSFTSLYAATPLIHLQSPSHVKTTLERKKKKDTRPTPVICSVSTSRILHPHPPTPRGTAKAISVAPNGGTAPSVTGLSQFILEDYQLSAADSSTGAPALDASAPARRSTARHN